MKILRYAFLISIIFLVSFCNDNKMVNQPSSQKAMVISLTADNPKIEAIIHQINIDSVRSYIDQLVGFFTRHTNSDTISGERGIGAARRWVFRKFKQFSQQNGGRLKVTYHNFEANILGVQGLHRNVVAELPGTQNPERKFVISGHLDSRNRNLRDSVNFAPGANDDGSGVACILELARIFSQFEFENTIIFVAFTGEEEGLFGSRAFARDLKSQNVNVVGMVTNDIIGNIVGGSGKIDSTSVRCFSENPTDSPHRQLARFIKLQGEAYLPDFTVNLIQSRDRPGRGGDHFAFYEHDYTAARLTEPEDNLNHQHNMQDLPEFMSFTYLSKVIKVNAAYLATWADAPVTPEALNVEKISGGLTKISWSKGEEAQEINYILAFRNPTSVSYDSLLWVGKTNEFILQSLEPYPDGLFLSLSAVDKDSNESIFSKEVFIK